MGRLDDEVSIAMRLSRLIVQFLRVNRRIPKDISWAEVNNWRSGAEGRKGFDKQCNRLDALGTVISGSLTFAIHVKIPFVSDAVDIYFAGLDAK